MQEQVDILLTLKLVGSASFCLRISDIKSIKCKPESILGGDFLKTEKYQKGLSLSLGSCRQRCPDEGKLSL